MFERFTRRARQVVVFSQDESVRLRHNFIGTEHLLLGLLRQEEGIAARVLASFGLTLEETRAQVARVVGVGDEQVSGQIPFTPNAKKALELALRESLAMGQNHVGTEHILLGLLRVSDGVAAQVLGDLGIDEEIVRDRLVELPGGSGRKIIRPPGVDPEAGPEPREAHPASFAERAMGYGPGRMQHIALVTGWILFGVSLGLGVLIGWAIWGL